MIGFIRGFQDFVLQETFGNCTDIFDCHKWEGEIVLASNRQRSAMLPNILQFTGHFPLSAQQRIMKSKMSIVVIKKSCITYICIYLFLFKYRNIENIL